MEKNYFERMQEIADEIIDDIINMFIDNHIENIVIPDDFYILVQSGVKTIEQYKLTEISYHKQLIFHTEYGNKFVCSDLILSIFAELHPYVKHEIERMKKAIELEDDKIKNDCSTSYKIFFVPNEHNPNELDDFDFVGKAFKYGKVMDIYDFVAEFNSAYGSNYTLNKGQIRVLEYSDNCVELCPHCGNEVLLKSEFKMQVCPICKRNIAPCCLCDTCTDDCPFRNL